jgi:hypothetical protein
MSSPNVKPIYPQPTPIRSLSMPREHRVPPQVTTDLRHDSYYYDTPWTATLRVRAKTPQDVLDALSEAYDALEAQLLAAAEFAAQNGAQP